MAKLWKGVAATVGRVGRRGSPVVLAAGLTPSPARLARRRQVGALQRRRLVYAPDLDGRADPGEIVWTWVAYEEDPGQGKDRPVLAVGRQGRNVFGLMLSSRDRDGQRHWLALGPGGWNRDGRPSWVRLDRVLMMREDRIRREGAVLDQDRFDRVGQVLRTGYGWT
ncbi:MAG: type II toxin-antitoxin system PemK/MazF family toxin [Micromonosporaceae bacterium]|nr:type II toxin-antitoxin system PemK/MazF family toxin [Micromonosporaceae bacterium]